MKGSLRQFLVENKVTCNGAFKRDGVTYWKSNGKWYMRSGEGQARKEVSQGEYDKALHGEDGGLDRARSLRQTARRLDPDQQPQRQPSRLDDLYGKKQVDAWRKEVDAEKSKSTRAGDLFGNQPQGRYVGSTHGPANTAGPSRSSRHDDDFPMPRFDNGSDVGSYDY